MKLNDLPHPNTAVAVALPPQEISQYVLRDKHSLPGETSCDQVFRRIATGTAVAESLESREQWEERFYQTQVAGFITAGRISLGAGSGLEVTLINCFVQPIDDCFSGKNGEVGIYDALKQAGESMRRGGGEGYDFSPLRPEGALVKGTASRASGPVPFIQLFNHSGGTIDSAGRRRGAQIGILRCDHPDIEAFIDAKDTGEFKNFNLSVAVTNDFVTALRADAEWHLVHKAEPSPEQIAAGAYQRADGKWVYRTVRARALMDRIIGRTYRHGDPGVWFIDTVNRDNNLWYCEYIRTCNACGEQPLPPYGCCDLGSMNLARFVRAPFTDEAFFDFEAFEGIVPYAVRMLDNVLDVTVWPLEEQRREAMNKRRIGLGFLGLGDALVMLRTRYDSEEGRALAAEITRRMRDAAYNASVDLAIEKGAFPLFDAEQYLADRTFASRLPEEIKARIRKHGIRNSHLLSIAPTGTIPISFADNASSGIEPIFSTTYSRKVRMPDGSKKEFPVEDHAYRLFRHMHGQATTLPSYFVTALEISPVDHILMVAAVQPFIDAGISKTINVPEDYPYENFKDLYLLAYDKGLKGITTYRPNPITGSVLTPEQAPQPAGEDLEVADPDRRIRLEQSPAPSLASLRWPGRPELPNGNPCWTYSVRHPLGDFAVFIGHIENGKPYPFEVWVNGAEQPRGLGAIAKTLSMDMRTNDRRWLDMKLQGLQRASGDDGFALAMPPSGELTQVPSLVAGFAKLVRHRCQELAAFEALEGASPVLDTLLFKKEPKAGPDGTLSWTVDVKNGATGDDFCFFMKELVMPDGQRRPYSMWLAGEYPRVFDGLCKTLSLDMWVLDPAWIGMKLRKLLSYSEVNGAFMSRIPGSKKMQTWPSTIAYLAQLMIHRYAMLGILSEEGFPVLNTGILDVPAAEAHATGQLKPIAGKKCEECANSTLIRKDGCEFCTSCGYTGACG